MKKSNVFLVIISTLMLCGCNSISYEPVKDMYVKEFKGKPMTLSTAKYILPKVKENLKTLSSIEAKSERYSEYKSTEIESESYKWKEYSTKVINYFDDANEPGRFISFKTTKINDHRKSKKGNEEHNSLDEKIVEWDGGNGVCYTVRTTKENGKEIDKVIIGDKIESSSSQIYKEHRLTSLIGDISNIEPSYFKGYELSDGSYKIVQSQLNEYNRGSVVKNGEKVNETGVSKQQIIYTIDKQCYLTSVTQYEESSIDTTYENKSGKKHLIIDNAYSLEKYKYGKRKNYKASDLNEYVKNTTILQKIVLNDIYYPAQQGSNGTWAVDLSKPYSKHKTYFDATYSKFGDKQPVYLDTEIYSYRDESFKLYGHRYTVDLYFVNPKGKEVVHTVRINTNRLKYIPIDRFSFDGETYLVNQTDTSFLMNFKIDIDVSNMTGSMSQIIGTLRNE